MRVITISGKARCVDRDTEYFNGEGWKKISEYTEGDRVLQYLDNGRAELVKPLDYIVEPCSEFALIETAYLSMCVTPDHEAYYITSKGNLYHKSYEEVIKDYNRSCNGFTGRFITSFSHDGGGIPLSDEEIELRIAIFADGTIRRGHEKNIRFNLKKERKIKKVEELLIKNNIEYKKYNADKGFVLFYFHYDCEEKEFESYWYNCSRHQKEIIIQNIFFWDGMERDGRKTFFSTSKKTADFVQYVFSSSGYYSAINIDNRVGQYHSNGKYKYKTITYNVSCSSRSLHTLTVPVYKGRVKRPIEYIASTDGCCYCFTVPSGKLVLRRNNRIYITGNCGKDTLATELKGIFDRNDISCFIMHYADFLKMICTKNYGWNGEKDEKGRSLLQHVGTEVFRAADVNVWTDMMLAYIKGISKTVKVLIIPDVRFPNEIIRLRDSIYIDGIFSIVVKREQFKTSLTKEQRKHPSETALDGWEFDCIVNNDTDLKSFLSKAEKVVELYNFSQKKEIPVI